VIGNIKVYETADIFIFYLNT